MPRTRCISAQSVTGGRRSVPQSHSADTVDVGGQSGASLVQRNEEISGCRKDRDEALQTAGRSKSLHYPFSLSQCPVRILCPIVQALVRSMFDTGHDIPFCGAVGAQFVGDDALRHQTLLLQPSRGSLGIASGRVEHIPVLIDSPPQPVLAASNSDYKSSGPGEFPPPRLSKIQT